LIGLVTSSLEKARVEKEYAQSPAKLECCPEPRASLWLGLLLLDTVTKTWMRNILLVLANKTLTGGNLLHIVKYQEPLT